MDLFIGIDLGSTTLKSIAYDISGNLIAQGSRPTLRFHPDNDHPDWTVWDPNQIWNDTAEACKEMVAKLAESKLDSPQIRGVAVTGMGMDGLPMDEKGDWLYPFISWHDPRTKPQFDWWMKNITAEKTFSIGGNPVWPINSALRILWVKENEPEIYKKTYKWLLIEDFVNFKLTGKYVTDFSMASCTMLFDQKTQTWSDEMCQLAGIPKSLLPDAFQSATLLGEITESAANQTGLPAGTPIYLGGHDHICSGIPVGAFRAGAVMDITGTWETVHIISEKPPLDPALSKAGVTIQSHVIPNRYSMWGGNPAGEMVEWYRREVASSIQEDGKLESWDWKTLVNLAESSRPGAGGVMFLPHLDSSSCPIVDPRSLGVFVGMSSRTKQGDLIRAVIEGLDFQFLDTVRAMEKATATEAKEFIAVGGAIRNAFWMQNKADMVGRPVRIPEVEEATVLGAAILAGIGCGVFKDAEDAFAQTAKQSTVYEPNTELTKLYSEMYPIYQELYRSVAPVNHKLYDMFIG
ncbi:MAG: FGGY-family carbohydrate kinase [Thermoguttaceae bacterium]